MGNFNGNGNLSTGGRSVRLPSVHYGARSLEEAGKIVDEMGSRLEGYGFIMEHGSSDGSRLYSARDPKFEDSTTRVELSAYQDVATFDLRVSNLPDVPTLVRLLAGDDVPYNSARNIAFGTGRDAFIEDEPHGSSIGEFKRNIDLWIPDKEVSLV